MNRQWNRGGILVSDKMLKTLAYLKLHKGDLVLLPDVHSRTLRAMQNHDLIVQGRKHPDGQPRYKITGRGLKVLKLYEKPVKRTDGICCRCGEKERGTFKTGTQKPYCDDCYREHGRKQHALKGYQINPETPYSRCKKRQRKQLPNGQHIAYCDYCRRILRKKERKRKMKRKFYFIRIGQPPRCCRCKTEPVYYSAKTVYDYCYSCYRQQQNQAAQRRKEKQSNQIGDKSNGR